MINIVIPMAGAGSRFARVGYQKPKPFIDVVGKPMIYHVLQNLSIPDSRFILLVRTEHFLNEKATIEKLKNDFNVEIVFVDRLTEGAACTVMYAHKIINNEDPLLIANSDQLVDMNISEFIFDSDKRGLDGSILCFEDSDKKWSYARIDSNGYILEVKEKQVISNYATVGIYYFSHGRCFIENAIDMFVRNDRVNNEFYVAPVYNYAISSGCKFGVFTIKKEKMHGIGTPEDLNIYLNLLKSCNNNESI